MSHLYVSSHRRHDKAHAEGAPMHVSRMTRRTFLSMSGLTAEALGDGSKTDAHVLCGPHARARPRHDSIKGPSCGGSSRRSFLKALTVAGSRIRHCTAKTAMTTYDVLASELT